GALAAAWPGQAGRPQRHLLLGRGDRDLLHALRLSQERAGRPDRPATSGAAPSGSGGVRMRKQDFENLVESVRQAGRIRRGEAEASCEVPAVTNTDKALEYIRDGMTVGLGSGHA